MGLEINGEFVLNHNMIVGTNDIVKSDLLLYLDAGDISSNSSIITGSTAWFDISGQGHTASLNGATYSSVGGGSVIFDGVNDSMTTLAFKSAGVNNNVNDNTTNEIWYKWNGVNQVDLITFVGTDEAVAGYLGFYINDGTNSNNTGNKVVPIMGGQFFNSLQVGTLFATLTPNWTQLVITKDTTTTKLYQNGVFLGSGTRSQTTFTTLSPYKTGFGTHAGNLAICRLYNRALTDDEVLRNYNVTKSRFPQFVTDNLILYLDAADANSLVSGSTTWRDLSGRGNTASLVGGATYSSVGGGSVFLDGTNDSMTTLAFKGVTGSNNNINNNTTNEIWYKWNGVNQADLIVILGDAGTNGYLGFYMNDGGNTSNVGNKVSVIFGGQFFNALETGTTFATLTTDWTQLVITKDTTTTKLYQNGVFLGSTTRTQTAYTGPGQYNTGVGTAEGNLGLCRLYERALTDNEVLQNYNATKSRFGL